MTIAPSSFRLFAAASAILFSATALSSSAQATVYDFNISTSQDTASGQFTTNGTTVIGVTGTVDNTAITGLSGYGASDQQLNATSPFVDRAGVAFQSATLAFNIFENIANNGVPVYSFCNSAFNGSCSGGAANAAPVAALSVSQVSAVSAVPEPVTWMMMIGGLSLVGGALRRRRSVTTSVRFA